MIRQSGANEASNKKQERCSPKVLRLLAEDTKVRQKDKPSHLLRLHPLHDVAGSSRIEDCRSTRFIAYRAKHHILPYESKGHRRRVEYIAGHNVKLRMVNVDCSGIADSCRHLMALRERTLEKAATHSSAPADNENLHQSLSLPVR